MICVITVCALPCLNAVVFGGSFGVLWCVLGEWVVAELLVIDLSVCVVGGGLWVIALLVCVSDFLLESIKVESNLLLGFFLLLELAELVCWKGKEK